LGGVERSSDNEIVVYAQSLGTKEWRRITPRLEEAEPHGVTVLSCSAFLIGRSLRFHEGSVRRFI
jgi:hypothetical protein